jgi:hypothetical protein
MMMLHFEFNEQVVFRLKIESINEETDREEFRDEIEEFDEGGGSDGKDKEEDDLFDVAFLSRLPKEEDD